MALELELATPTRLVVSAEADEVVVPGVEGYFGVLPGHAAFLTTLGSGELTYSERGHQRPLAVSGGFAEVRNRSEERRVGKECRSRWSRERDKKKTSRARRRTDVASGARVSQQRSARH